MIYGVNDLEQKAINNHLNYQKEFLQNSFLINTKFDTKKSLYDINRCANFSKSYYAEIVNRVNTFTTINTTKNYKAIFLTVTLNSCFHTNNFKDFKADDLRILKAKLTEKDENKNYKYKNALEKYYKNIAFNNNNLKDILNYCFKLFSCSINREAKKITNDKKIRCEYIKVLEPHKKSGVPHLHALIYIPNDEKMLDFCKKAFKRYFYAPQNLKADKKRLSKEQIISGDFNGFQTILRNPAGYILKYLTKSFKNMTNHKESDKINLSKLECWYIKNKVRRFMSSRYSFPLTIYRKLGFIENLRCFCDFQLFTENKENYFSWNTKKNIFYCRINEIDVDICINKNNFKYYLCNDLQVDYNKSEHTDLRLVDSKNLLKVIREKENLLQDIDDYKKELEKSKIFKFLDEKFIRVDKRII